MGFFSFKTHDTHKSIWNWHTGLSFPVQMTDNKGNRWIEDSYSGYGMFGGKDYYELLAEMNGKTTREQGIDLYFAESKNTLCPNLSEDMQWIWRNERTDDCPWQGFFANEDDENDIIEYEEEHEDYEDKNWLFDEY